MYDFDNRIVMTLDAGGTNFVFTAICGNREIVAPVHRDACADNLDRCLDALVDGFTQIRAQLQREPVAISFAFPGPADYRNGVIGDLPNFPSFRGGVALGEFLHEKFEVPVFINNDGNLFAYGEALAGALPYVNSILEHNSTPPHRIYRNLLGVTLGTGFGAGVVINNTLLSGDNGCGGDVWIFRNKKYPNLIAEEGVSIRAVKRVYGELSGSVDALLTPKEIFDIAEGTKSGDRTAAVASFAELGEIAADAISYALTIVDGIVVLGGGLCGAYKYIVPSLMSHLNGQISTLGGDTFPALQMRAYDLSDSREAAEFFEPENSFVSVPGGDRKVLYTKTKRTAVLVSRLGTSRAVSLGAYAYALAQLDQNSF